MTVILPPASPPIRGAMETPAFARPTGIGPLLERLDPEQRAAATLPDGPALIVAPAGSGKTTTLIAHLAVLLSRGTPADRIAVVTFNRDAAIELSTRIEQRLVPLAPSAAAIEVRTLHAMARQVLLDGGGSLDLVSDRVPLLRAALRRAAVGRAEAAEPLPDASALDTFLSAWKVEGREPPPEAQGPLAAYATLLEARGALDFDDLLVRAAARLESDPALRLRWQARFAHVCVDEFQDVDAAQLRFVRILAEPERNLFVVGDDDQTIYAWRLADVRRILEFGRYYPDAQRVILATNYRCPAGVVAVSRRLIDHNRERLAKRIRAGAVPPGAAAPNTTTPAMSAVSTAAEDWPDRLATLAGREAGAERPICFLARTRTELGPMQLALVRARVPHRTSVPAILDADPVRELLAAAQLLPPAAPAFATMLGLREARGWRRRDAADQLDDDEQAALDALLGWATGFPTLGQFLVAAAAALERLSALRRPDARVELVTVHGAKGREWETVVVLGMEVDRFPNRRALLGGAEPARALEEERRLAYVALTRATRRLILAYDPRRPSPFLAEMGVTPRDRPPGPTG